MLELERLSMQGDFQDETHYFRYCRRLDGGLEPVDIVRRNGRSIPRFHPSICDAPESEEEESDEYRELVEEITAGLTDAQRRALLRLADNISLSEIAEEEEISRQA